MVVKLNSIDPIKPANEILIRPLRSEMMVLNRTKRIKWKSWELKQHHTGVSNPSGLYYYFSLIALL